MGTMTSHQPHDCLLICLFRRRSKKASKIRVTGLCEENSPVTGEFPAQRASNVEEFLSYHYNDVVMTTIASQITSLTVVYSTVYSDADQTKHQSSASLAFVWWIHRGPVNSPHKWPVTRKMFPFDDVIMSRIASPKLWRHNGHDSVSNHQPHDCLLNRLFRRRSN